MMDAAPSTSGQAVEPLAQLPPNQLPITMADLVYLASNLPGREEFDKLQERLRAAGRNFQPAICKRKAVDAHFLLREMGIQVDDWRSLKTSSGRRGPSPMRGSLAASVSQQRPRRPDAESKGPPSSNGTGAKAARQPKTKAAGSGRTYTSKYRGVHQTFPTKRWEAQFRRNGKPTSLGCFDREVEAAKAYDKMMLWCELHNAVGVKSGITNFEMKDYETDIPWLQRISQDQLIESLRGEGRRQAAHRMLRAKREGTDVISDDTDEEDENGEPRPEGGAAEPADSQLNGSALQGEDEDMATTAEGDGTATGDGDVDMGTGDAEDDGYGEDGTEQQEEEVAEVGSDVQGEAKEEAADGVAEAQAQAGPEGAAAAGAQGALEPDAPQGAAVAEAHG